MDLFLLEQSGMKSRVGILHDRKNHDENNESDNDDRDGFHKFVTRENIIAHEYGDKAEHTADGIQYLDGFLLGEAHVDKAVMEVSAVCFEGTLPVQDPAAESKNRFGKS